MKATIRTLAVCLAAATAAIAQQDWIRRGIDLREHDQPAKALDSFRQAIDHEPLSLRAHSEYIRTMAYDLDRWDEVRAEYEALARHHPNSTIYPMALATGQGLTPGPGKARWYEAVARIAPDSAWGILARAQLESARDPLAAAEAFQRSIALDPTLREAYLSAIVLRENKLHDPDAALRLARKLAAQSDPDLRAPGLYEQWRLRLLQDHDSPAIVAAVKREQDQLARSERDMTILSRIRTARLMLLKDSAGAKEIEQAIRRIDPGWYPERGSQIYAASSNESGVPRQLVVVNRQVAVVSQAFNLDPATPVADQMDSLRAVLPEAESPAARMIAYRALFRLADQSADLPHVIEFGEKYKEAEEQYEPAAKDPVLLAKIALARAERGSDLPRAAAYAKEADAATAVFQPWKTPRNTDEAWFAHYDQAQQHRSWENARAYALEARGWTLCASGHCAEGEPLLCQAVELHRSEGNLRHLASTVEKLGRADEAAEISKQAQDEWLDSLRRKLRKEPSKDFTVPALDGRSIELSSLKGKVVLVNFWATWCTPCAQEMPLFNELYAKYREQGFEILAISVDDEDARHKVAPFVKEHALAFPVAYDQGVKDLYQVTSYPTSLLIDRDGALRLRFNIAEKRSLDAMIAELLK